MLGSVNFILLAVSAWGGVSAGAAVTAAAGVESVSIFSGGDGSFALPGGFAASAVAASGCSAVGFGVAVAAFGSSSPESDRLTFAEQSVSSRWSMPADGSDSVGGGSIVGAGSIVGPIGASAARTGGSVAFGRLMGVDGFAPSHFPGGVSVCRQGGAITTGGPTGVGCPGGSLSAALVEGRRFQIGFAV